MKEGIYFNMPEEEYHKLSYFSNSTGGLINIEPSEYWHYSEMNPEKPEKEETDAMAFGKALHCMFLEPEVFKKLYVCEPNQDDYKHLVVLDTVDQLKAELRTREMPLSGNKPELITRLKAVLDPKKHLIWEKVLNKFQTEVATNKLRVLSAKDMRELMKMKQTIEKYYPRIMAAFSGGYSEVVIIWQDKETGVMCKARLDYLRPDAIGDLKSFSLKGKKNLSKAINDSIVYERYNVQYVIYLDAVKQLIKKIKINQAVISGDVPKEWIEKFLMSENKRFFFAFIRSEAPYQCEGIELERSSFSDASPNVYFSEGVNLFRKAINIYAECVKKYGTSPWVKENYIRKLIDEDVPNVMYQSYGN